MNGRLGSRVRPSFGKHSARFESLESRNMLSAGAWNPCPPQSTTTVSDLMAMVPDVIAEHPELMTAISQLMAGGPRSMATEPDLMAIIPDILAENPELVEAVSELIATEFGQIAPLLPSFTELAPIAQESWPAGAPLATSSAAAYTVERVAKAQPDEFFNGVGQPYIPLGEQGPDDVGQPKVNQDYVWSMTQAGDYIAFASAGNVNGGFGGHAIAGPILTDTHVLEGGASQYPISPSLLRYVIGDWRPPEIHLYNTKTDQYMEITPDDPAIEMTLGLRSAAANDELVLFAGPSRAFLGMNVFAFDAQTGDYLGSKRIFQYSDVREWVNVDGQLYAGVGSTVGIGGEGAVIRWDGTVADPFQFTEVGRMDLTAANIVEHEGRLYVSTWPKAQGVPSWFVEPSSALAGIWVSPELGDDGLQSWEAYSWRKVWDISDYEPDPVIARTYGLSTMESFDGHLYWGTMQQPGTGMLEWREAYPNTEYPEGPLFTKTSRGTALFRSANLDSYSGTDVEMLFGDPQLWKYTPNDPGDFHLVDSPAGDPLYGYAGFHQEFMPERLNTLPYTWSMEVHHENLYVGLFDYSVSFFGDVYVEASGDVNVAEQILASQGMPGVRMGADLWCVPSSEANPFAVTRVGGNNPLNYGFRTMQSTERGLFVGTATPANLLTDPQSPLQTGGWELLKMGDEVEPTQQSDPPTVAAPNRISALLDVIGELNSNLQWNAEGGGLFEQLARQVREKELFGPQQRSLVDHVLTLFHFYG